MKTPKEKGLDTFNKCMKGNVQSPFVDNAKNIAIDVALEEQAKQIFEDIERIPQIPDEILDTGESWCSKCFEQLKELKKKWLKG